MSDAIVIQPDDDDLSKPPADLNDFHAWFKRGRPDLAFEGLLNQITIKIGNEQTSQMLLKNQERRDEALAKHLGEVVFTLRGDIIEVQGQFQEQFDLRFDAYNQELDVYREQHKALLTLVEERLIGPFSRVVQRVDDLEYGYAQLANRLDTALDPDTPGATIEQVVLQDRVALLTRLVYALVGMDLFLLILMAVHVYLLR